MAILSNTPTLSYIYIKDMIITHNDTHYQIQNIYTNKPYIYFDTNQPYTLVTSNVSLQSLAGRYYICFNDKGNPTLVPQTEISISFSENTSRDLINEKIIGFQQTNEMNQERFATIEQTVDGIKQTVGGFEEGIDGNSLQISLLQQKTDEISASVNSIERIYSEDADAKVLRDNVSVAILTLQSTLGLFSSDMNTYMEDNRLSATEREEIAAYESALEADRLELNIHLDTIISALNGNGQVDKANTLITQRDLLNTSVNNLINNINTVCTDNVFTNTEIVTVIAYFSNVNSKLVETKNLVDEYIFLGVGGELIEEIGKLNVKQDQISLGVSRTESILKNNLNLKKSLIQDIISSNNTALTNYKNCLNVITNDGAVSSEERDSLQVRIDAMDTNVANITIKKDELLGEELLNDEQSEALVSAYNEFINRYDTMKATVDNIISDGIVHYSETITMNEAINNYYNSLNNIHSALCKASDDMETNGINKSISDAKSELRAEMDELSESIGDLILDVDQVLLSGFIDKEEKGNILQRLNTLEMEKIDIDNRFDEWYNSSFLYGSLKQSYKQIYDTCIDKYNALYNLCNTVANKQESVTDEERVALDLATDEFLIALDSFLKESEVIIGIITSNEMNYIKNNLSKEFNDINSALNDLSSQMNESFKDGIITELELRDTEAMLSQLDKEKLDIDATYDEIYNNDNLD